jgi:hypothetical protein
MCKVQKPSDSDCIPWLNAHSLLLCGCQTIHIAPLNTVKSITSLRQAQREQYHQTTQTEETV